MIQMAALAVIAFLALIGVIVIAAATNDRLEMLKVKIGSIENEFLSEKDFNEWERDTIGVRYKSVFDFSPFLTAKQKTVHELLDEYRETQKLILKKLGVEEHTIQKEKVLISKTKKTSKQKEKKK